jgi:hypothetical protein
MRFFAMACVCLFIAAQLMFEYRFVISLRRILSHYCYLTLECDLLTGRRKCGKGSIGVVDDPASDGTMYATKLARCRGGSFSALSFLHMEPRRSGPMHLACSMDRVLATLRPRVASDSDRLRKAGSDASYSFSATRWIQSRVHF